MFFDFVIGRHARAGKWRLRRAVGLQSRLEIHLITARQELTPFPLVLQINTVSLRSRPKDLFHEIGLFLQEFERHDKPTVDSRETFKSAVENIHFELVARHGYPRRAKRRDLN